MEQPGTYEILEPIVSGSLRGRHDTSVVTRMSFPAGPAEIWERLMYYEQILKRAPMLLRFLLPTPIRAEGSKSKVGCESRCHYTDGYLLKRATRIVRKQCLQFEIVEQQLMIGNGITCSVARTFCANFRTAAPKSPWKLGIEARTPRAGCGGDSRRSCVINSTATS
jgi:hypothetical protein